MSPTALAPWLDRLRALDDLESGARVVVGCSGGADSLALLALASAAGFDVGAVYVDHGLRSETTHEARVVANAAARFGAHAVVEHVDVETGANLEARARAARYDALERARLALGADAILVGHTRDDQAETVLLNFLRGSGVAGMAGAHQRRDALRRPLLGLRRADTREICARLGLAPVCDPMNDDVSFRRVWLRREILPRLERGAARDLVDVLARQAEVLRDDSALLDDLAATHDAQDVAALCSLPDALARRVVRRWLGAPPPSIATVDRVLAVARGELAVCEVAGGRRVERRRGRLALSEAREVAPAVEPASLPLPGSTRFGGYEISAWIEHAAPAAWPDGRTVAVCDAARVTAANAQVRPARPTDHFLPLGRTSTKRVRDAQADAGFSARERRDAPVVVAGNVIWVVGYRIDDRVRVSGRTREFLWLSAEPGSP
jgi:tRNA(Ile)-lysidine synthase